MKKETLTFPDYESLWNFKEKTKAINIRIEPGKNRITGLFDSSEIEMALNEFQAISSPYATNAEMNNPAKDQSIIHIRFGFKNLANRMSSVLKTLFFSFPV